MVQGNRLILEILMMMTTMMIIEIIAAMFKIMMITTMFTHDSSGLVSVTQLYALRELPRA